MDSVRPIAAKEYRVLMSALEFDVIYRVREIRLKRNLSPEDLSFLLGCKRNYIRNVEDPTNKNTYNTALINYFPKVLDCQIQELIANDLPGDDHIQFKAKKQIKRSQVYYEITQLIGETDRDNAIKFEFVENLPTLTTNKKDKIIKNRKRGRPKKGKAPTLPKNNPAENTLQLITDLFETGFFATPQSPLNVYNRCKKELGSSTSCIYIEEALSTFTRKKKSPKLKRIKNAEARLEYIRKEY